LKNTNAGVSLKGTMQFVLPDLYAMILFINHIPPEQQPPERTSHAQKYPNDIVCDVFFIFMRVRDVSRMERNTAARGL
jgi:hypothetical protein